MAPIPHGAFGRLAAVAWLLAWLAVLGFAIVQRDIHDTDIAIAYFLLFLSFPAGYLVAAGVGMIFHALYEFAGVVVPGGLVGNV